MKTLYFTFCLISTISFSQTKFDEKQILKQEVQNYQHDVDMDTILVNKMILPYEKDFITDFKFQAERTGMSKNEIENIFGKDGEKLFKACSAKYWKRKSFEGLKVIVHDEKNNKRNVRNKLSYEFGISKLLIREDKKFAIIQTQSSQMGGILNVYKYSDDGWVFYKSITISYS
ncbi:MAG TPA: hypothetical protein VK623_09930 [Flavobacterium sp.]|nr:hypothetical protein [Flavobacterium sp.]